MTALFSRRRNLLRAAGFSLGLTVPVAVLAYVVRAGVGPVLSFDHALISAGTDFARDTPGLRSALLAWQEAFNARWVNLAAALVCLWVWRRRGMTSRALWAFLTILVAWNLGLVVKFVVQRARPVVEEALTHAPGYSFPSGHTTNIAATGLTVILLVWPLLGPKGRVVAPVLVGLAVLLTAVDRVLIGAHYPSDTVAGILLGVAMAGGSYLGYIGWRPPLLTHNETPAPHRAAR
jgi:membrane-associated phospholipid phosphatase